MDSLEGTMKVNDKTPSFLAVAEQEKTHGSSHKKRAKNYNNQHLDFRTLEPREANNDDDLNNSWDSSRGGAKVHVLSGRNVESQGNQSH